MWEDVAAWWQEGFTEGADPEYEEQILPLLMAHLAGSSRILDVGCGEGQVGRRAMQLDGVTFVAGIDPTWAQVQVASRRDGGVEVVRGRLRPPVRCRLLRRRGGLPGVRAHRRD